MAVSRLLNGKGLKGMFEGLQKKLNKEELTTTQSMQLLFRDNESVIFRKLPVEHTCLVEKKDDEVVRAWKHYYGMQYPFNGYGSIPAGYVTLAFERDIILDPHGILNDKEKPQGEGLMRFKDVAESRCRQIEVKPGESLLIDKFNLALIIGFVGLVLAIILKVAL